MSDKMLFEGTLVLVAGGAWLRVGSMMATDLSESCRCCGGCCCSCVASELRWWGSRLIFLGGLGMVVLAVATLADTDTLGSLATEVLALIVV
ncbi:unnamed protein product, partial [Durusdinium trenchii]